MTSVATGTVTLLFTDIEGSTRLLRELGGRYETVLADHHRLLRDAFSAQGGSEMDTAGDGLFYAFPRARQGLLAAVAGQRALAGHEWPAPVRVRMGLHTGEPTSGDLGYVGIDVHRAARISGAAHGGQIVVSQTTHDLAGGDLPGDVLFADLGEHQLKDLPAPERLFQVVAPDLARDFPPLRSIDSREYNLPRQLTSFIGRQQEIVEARRAIATAPLLTLTGPGGVGKTRLAIEIAGELLDEFDEGIWFVDLGALTDPDFVVPSIASAIGLMPAPGQPMIDTLKEHLRGRRVLLVLDNCEHLLEETARTVDGLLRACGSLRVIATSRESLAIAGEAAFPVPSLSLPEGDAATVADLGQYESIRLFVERAMAAVPGFRVTDRNAAAIAQICRRLDGVPLALELAAARVRALPVEQIAARLDDRFRLLTGSSRVTVPRHQTLRQTIDWSHDLLAEDERAVFRRLAVFVGGCSIEAAEAVCAGDPVEPYAVLDLLSRLVDKSLLIAETEGAEGRYRQLESIRQYARDRLLESGEAGDTLRRHRDWYMALVAQAEPTFFRGAESAEWLGRLEREHDNLRAALQWSLDEPDEQRAGLRLAAGLWRFWEIRGHLSEGRGWLERFLEATSGEVSSLQADAYTGAGILAFMLGDHAGASALHERSLALHRQVGDPAGMAMAANNLGNAAALSGDYSTARRLYEPGLAWSRERGDLRVMAFALVNMAEAVALDGEPELARSQYEEGLAAFREAGDRWGEAFALDSLGVMLGRQGEHATAAGLHEDAIAISRSIGDERGVARAVAHLGEVAARRGDLDRARTLYVDSLEIRRRLGDMPGTASAMEKLAALVTAKDPHGAAVLLGAAERVRDLIRAPVPRAVREEYERCREEVRGLLGDAPFDEARAEGRRLSPAGALATILP
jgi:predicted ATPase/class 3 adenylate cyclase/Tfp pilus assembly protein PilF